MQKIVINLVGVMCLLTVLTLNVDAQVKKVNVNAQANKVNVNAVKQNANTGKNNLSIPESEADKEKARLQQLLCLDIYSLHNRCQNKCFDEYFTCVEACTAIDDFDDRLDCRDNCGSEYPERYPCANQCDSRYFTQECPNPYVSSQPKSAGTINVSLSDLSYDRFSDPKIMDKLKPKLK